MIFLAAAAAAATFMPPVPVDQKSWFQRADIPNWLTPDHVYQVMTALTVTPAGKVSKCIVEHSSGDVQLDKRACDILSERAKFQPAKDLNGAPTYGVIRIAKNFILLRDARRLPKPTEANLDLQVSQLPKDLAPYTEVAVVFTADAEGRPVQCKANDATTNSALAGVDCSEVLKDVKDFPVTDTAGRPVATVRTMKVGFSAS